MIGTLRDAVHAAGARRAVTSLWKVSDRATVELMGDFYRRMWRGKESVSEALWGAKKRTRDTRDALGQPAYGTRDWAGFVASGMPRR